MRVWAIRLTACFTIIQGFVNGVSLVFVSIGIVCESATRFIEPKPMGSSGLMTTSVIGLAVNALGVNLQLREWTQGRQPAGARQPPRGKTPRRPAPWGGRALCLPSGPPDGVRGAATPVPRCPVVPGPRG